MNVDFFYSETAANFQCWAGLRGMYMCIFVYIYIWYMYIYIYIYIYVYKFLYI
jgi:hypothetical protein